MCICGRNAALRVCSECPAPIPGPPGTSIGIQVTVEPAGANCTYGGYKVVTGTSSLANGVPDGNLVTQYLCNTTPGAAGATPTFITGTITTLAPGNPATAAVVATANPNEYQINLGIPAGEDGVVLDWEIGTVTTVPDGTPASATVTLSLSDPPKYQLNLVIPAGPAGTTAAGSILFSSLSIPSCLTGTVLPGDSVQQVVEKLMTSICSLMSNAANAHGFLAELTSERPLDTLVDDLIPFDDDLSAGHYDNGNDFFTMKYICPIDGIAAMRFVAENLIFERIATGGGSDDLTVEIKKNGVLITGATQTVTVIDTMGIQRAMDAVITDNHITLVQGDVVTVEISHSNALARAEIKLLIGAKFSNSFAD